MSRLFDGVDDNLRVDSVPVTDYPFTMACWFRPDTFAADQVLIGLFDKDVDDVYQYLRYAGATAGDPVIYTARAAGASNQNAITSTGISSSTWTHACGVGTSATSRAAFINGGSKGTNATSRVFGAQDRTAIGRLERLTPATPMDGMIAEAAIWNVALTDAEVAALGKGVNPRLIRPGSVVFYAPLWGTSSPERDYTAGQRHLTVNGATVAAHPPVQVSPPHELWVPTITAAAGVTQTPIPGGGTASGAAPAPRSVASTGGAPAAGVGPVARVAVSTGGAIAGGAVSATATDMPTPGASQAGGVGPTAVVGASPGGAVAGGPSQTATTVATPTPGGATASANAPVARAPAGIGAADAAGSGPIARVAITPSGAIAGGNAPSFPQTPTPGGATAQGVGPLVAVPLPRGMADALGVGPSVLVLALPGGATAGGVSPTEAITPPVIVIDNFDRFPIGTEISAYIASEVELWLRERQRQPSGYLREDPPSTPLETQTMTANGATFSTLPEGEFQFVAVVQEKITRPGIPPRLQDRWQSVGRRVE